MGNAPSAERGEPAQAGQCPILGFARQPITTVQAGGKLHFLAHFLEGPDLSVYASGNHHMKTVGAHINSRQ